MWLYSKYDRLPVSILVHLLGTLHHGLGHRLTASIRLYSVKNIDAAYRC